MSTKKRNDEKNKGDVQIAVRYGVAIPERVLMELIRLDCAGRILKFGKELSKLSPKDILAKIKASSEVFSVASSVLGLIQETWKDALREYADSTKLPANFCPPGCKPSKKQAVEKEPVAKPTLSIEETKKIRALRKCGLSIKAIGKEIHRAEKVVADFVRTLPKEK